VFNYFTDLGILTHLYITAVLTKQLIFFSKFIYLFIYLLGKLSGTFFFYPKCKLNFFMLCEIHMATEVKKTVHSKLNLLVVSMNTRAGNSDFPFGIEEKEHRYDGLFQFENSLT
jgi:hypothetical protein